MVKPHGGKLVERIMSEGRRKKILESKEEFHTINVSSEIVKDVENIAFGAFSPLEGFALREDFISILNESRLSNDLPWTIPIVLDVSEDEIKGVSEGDEILLNNQRAIALMRVEEIYRYDKVEMAEKVFGTKDNEHPGVAKTLAMKEFLLGGSIELINESESPFSRFLLRPKETRLLFREKGWKSIVGFQTRNPPHIGHEYVQKTALTFVDGIFINPIIGRKKKGDFTDEIILETYNELIKNYYLKERAVLSILQTEMRYAGPKEAIFHALVRKNFGCTHFIVGRDHAGVGSFYSPYAAQNIFEEFPDLGIVPLFFKSFSICKKCNSVVNEKTCPHDKEQHVFFSGTEIREMLRKGLRPNEDLMRPEVADIIIKSKNPFVE